MDPTAPIQPDYKVMAKLPPGVILLGLTGSRLYGLDTPESDYDWKGIYQAPTDQLLGLYPPKGTHDVDGVDLQVHELGKYVDLALKCNPTLLELLWLPEYAILTEAGEELVLQRQRFLWSKPVRDAHLGHARQLLGWITGRKPEPGYEGGVRASYFDYARDQFRRLVDRDGNYKSKLKKRTAKHTRHLFRLMEQGEQLLTTGDLTPRVSDPERITAMGEMPVEMMTPIAERALDRFEKLPSVLPEKPQRDYFSELLQDLRIEQLMRQYDQEYRDKLTGVVARAATAEALRR